MISLSAGHYGKGTGAVDLIDEGAAPSSFER